jgi:FkbM family methyltransferase
VWAIEPNPNNVSFLLATRARNGFNNVEIIQAAASDRWEVLSLAQQGHTSNGTAVHPHGITPSDFLMPVMALPLSACLSSTGRIDIIKIDAEGAEGKAIGGMLDLIERDRPVIVSEFTPSTLPVVSRISPSEYLDLFARRGYKLAVLETSGPRALSAAELLRLADAIAPHDHLDILAEPA